MAWWHRKGQKVVCIDDDEDAYCKPHVIYRGGLNGLLRGKVYTIRNVGPSVIPEHDGAMCIWLQEIVRPYDPMYGECGFDAGRFRPVVNRSSESGVAALREHLITAPVIDRITSPSFDKEPVS